MKILEKRFNCIINYEDPPYEYRSEILNPARNSLAGGIIKIDWKNGENVENLLDILTQTTIEPRQDKDMFKWSSNERKYYVYPYKSKDTSGNPVERTPVMAQKISLNVKDVNGVSVIKSICSELSLKTGKKVESGTIPQSMSTALKDKIYSNFSAANRNTNEVLNRCLEEVNPKISWQLIYLPGSKEYQLNIYNTIE